MAANRLTPTSDTIGDVSGDDLMDDLAEEILALWNGSAIALTGIGGTANAIAAVLDPPLVDTLVDGMLFLLTPQANNTTTATLALNAASPVLITSLRGNSLNGGELGAGATALLRYDGATSKHKLISHPASRGQRATSTIAGFTITPDADPPLLRLTGTLAADQTLTLGTAGAIRGDYFDITRDGPAGFNWSIGGLVTLATKAWCRVVFDGTTWYLHQYGTLP